MTPQQIAIDEQAGHYDWNGHRIAYTSYGEGERTVVLIHGLLLSQKMHLPLARAIAERGYRAITLDVLGHGASDRPRDMTEYSMATFGQQVVGLLDALGVEDAVVLGTSLGANTSLEAAVFAPERIRGMVIEMPVLDTIRQQPGPSAAVLNGLFFGEVAPHRDVRRTIKTPTLVIGHRRDPVHPFSDAVALAEEIEGAKFLEADSLIELRIKPERLTGEVCAFVDECFEEPKQARKPRRMRAV